MTRATSVKTTRLSAGLLVSVLLLAAWTLVALTPVLAQIDRAITIVLQRVASTGLDIGFSLITILGNAEVTSLLALVIGIVLIRTGRAPLAIVIWALFAGGSAFEWIAKHRLPHPSVPLELQRRGINTLHYMIRTPFGYPSGHAFRTLFLAGSDITLPLYLWSIVINDVSPQPNAAATLIVGFSLGCLLLWRRYAAR